MNAKTMTHKSNDRKNEDRMKPSLEKLRSIADDALYTLEEAAALCGVTSAGVRAWTYRGVVKSVRVGSRFYISGVELKKAIQM